MAVRPTAKTEAEERELRGTGQLNKTTDYLKNDPASYYYQKFKDAGNLYLRDDMWSEAAKRGETGQLISALQGASKYESNDAFSKWESYAGYNDYDSYMLALVVPQLDNTTKKVRVDENTGYEFGAYTDQEWAKQILNHTFQGYDAQIIEEQKENTNFFVKTGAYLGSFWTRICSGFYNFAQDIYNLGEGVLNMMVNWSKDENVGNRFLWAFSNDEGQPLNYLADFYQKAAFEWERKYTRAVNAVTAHEQGYLVGQGDSFFDQVNNASGAGVGYTTWGRWWSAGTESIGYMLPSMIIPASAFGKSAAAIKAVKGVKQGLFYTGIFSGNVKDTVNRATFNGQSYKDLNAGEVVGNAFLKAGAQLAVEYALGAILGFSGLDRLMGVGARSTTRAIKKGLKNATATGIKAAGQVALRAGKDMLKEGLEEMLQDLSDGLIDYAFGGQFRQRGLETLSIQNLVDSFVVGGLTAGVIGAVTNASVILPKNREVGTTAEGEVFKMGVFQTLNYRQALETMSQWNDVLHNAKSSQQAKADAAFKMSVAIDTVGSVLKSFGTERAMMANQVLMAKLNEDAKRASAIAEMSDVKYATNLYEAFVKAHNDAAKKYVNERLEKKVKKAAERAAKKLKNGNVTAIENVITTETVVDDPDIPVEPPAAEKVKDVLSGLGAEAIVGVDGNIVTKSGDIVFADNKLVEAGDIENIIRGIAYDQVLESVKAKLTNNQRSMITMQYTKITGVGSTLDQALTALLFDKNFYTNILLLSAERRYKQAAIDILATIDQVIHTNLSTELANGRISEAAFKALLTKVQETMRAGLVTYATTYSRINLDEISDAVLSTELKAAIRNHQNVIFSNEVDEGLKDKRYETPSDERIKAFDTMINKFVGQLTAEEISGAKTKARSKDYNDRVDAYTLLTQVAKADRANQSGKLVYLPTDVNGEYECQQIAKLEQFFGPDWMSLIEGNYDTAKLTREATDFIMAAGYDMTNKQSRLACLRKVLFDKSNGLLTIGNDGAILQVIPRSEFMKPEYLTDTALKAAIVKGTVKTLQDLAVKPLPKELGEMSLVITNTLGTANGMYRDGTKTIYLSGRQISSSIMHEATHVTQYLTNVGIEDIAGGATGAFTVLPKDVITDIDKYLRTNFPATYNYMTGHKVTTPQLIYFMLSGELQANSTLTTHMFETGFRFKNNRQELVSPDGLQTWSLTPGQQENTEALLSRFKISETPKSEDRPLTRRDIEELRNDKETTEFLKGSALVRKDGTPMVFYRGTTTPENQLHDNGVFLSTKPYVSSMYANPDTGALRGYVVNIPRSKLAVIDADGASYQAIEFKGREWSTDELVNYVRQVYPEIEGLLIKNVVEDFGENYSKPGTNLVVFDTSRLRRATVEDSNRFQRAWREKINTLNPELTSNPETDGQPGATTYEAEFNKFAAEYARNDASFSEGIGDEPSRYISNKIANESNLKYWIKKGVPIQVDPGVANFVVATTKDFEKLPAILRKKIEGGTLTKFDILDYVATASRINDYTFRAIATEVFNNEALAEIGYKGMRKIMDQIESIAALAYIIEDADTTMTPDEMLAKVAEINNQIKADDKLAAKYIKAMKRAQTVKTITSEGNVAYTEAHADTKQLNSAFFRHYDGTIASVRNINNLGKYMTSKQTDQELRENVDTGAIDNKATRVWNWIERMKKADIDYESDDVAHSLDEISREEKIAVIKNYITEELMRRVQSLPEAERIAKARAIIARQQAEFKKLEEFSDKAINSRYLFVLGAEALPANERKLGPVLDNKGQPTGERTDKNRKDRLRNLARTITTRIAGLKTRYNALSPEVQKYIDPNNKYKLSPEYRSLSGAELDALIEAFAADSKKLRARLSMSQRAEALKRSTERRMTPKSTEAPKDRVETEPSGKKNVRDKVKIQYRTELRNQKFEVTSPTPATDIAKRLLDTEWSKTRMSTVQGGLDNTEAEISNAKSFFANNASLLMEASVTDINDTVRFFLDATMKSDSDSDYKKFQALKMYFLGYVFSESGAGKLYSALEPNLKQRIETALKNEVTSAGTLLSIWKTIVTKINPLEQMANASLELDGVELTEDEKTELFEAATSGDATRISDIQQRIIERVVNEKDNRKGILRKITTIRSMAMLSSPITWLRNVVSNMALKRLNKLSSAIGNRLWTGKTSVGQLKMTAKVTPEVQNFITQNFLDNKLFDTLVANLSKYNPSDIQGKYRDIKGEASKEVIITQMVIKSMYNQYYNENLFKSKWMNDLHNRLMKVMSDNTYVREAAVRYFGKMLAEKGYDLSKNEITDAIMNDFAVAVGLALRDYMHSDNVFAYLEKKISESSELGLFAWKTIMPFASSSWQWFKEALKYSPFGLGRAIINMARLEQRIANIEAKWRAGQTNVSPELVEYISRRDLGQGVIGTIGWTLGMLLAGFGLVKLEDDDYGIPKLKIGNLSIDISSIFGSSSLLAGAALITGMRDKGMTWDGFIEGLGRMADVTIDGLPLMQIVEMDLYADNAFEWINNQLETIALSFIPNILSWFAGATYSGTLDKKNFWGKAAAKIPFLAGWVNERKVNPYTGSEGSWWEAFNRVVPYLSIEIASETEEKSKQLGLNKSQLRGEYTINGEEFNLSPKEVNEINKAYGKWNAVVLEKFYKDQLKVKVKVGNTYKTLSYNQMDNDQRKRAVQNLMEQNATYAKILAWTKAGHKYYASATEYATLRSLGITSNVYRGTKGFVE